MSNFKPLAAALITFFSSQAFTQDDAPASPAGQPATSVVNEASDAFGEQFGIERLGLYSEAQVRGFDLLQSGGAYRIGDHYFSRATGLSESLQTGLSVNVGIASTRLDLPSPSGVVVYNLREPAEENEVSVSAGVRDNLTQHGELSVSAVNQAQDLGAVLHVMAQPEFHLGTGQEGSLYGGGGVVRWRPGDDSTVRLFGGYQWREYDGDYQILPSENRAPALLPRETNYAPNWAESEFVETNSGFLYDLDLEDWEIDASITQSQVTKERSDTAVLVIDPNGNVESTVVLRPSYSKTGYSAEIKALRMFHTQTFSHRVGVGVRGRKTSTGQPQAVIVDGGSFDIRSEPDRIDEPNIASVGPLTEDKVDEKIASLTYGASLSDWVDLKLGAHRSWYEKTLGTSSEDFSGSDVDKWFYNASTVFELGSNKKIFASYASGLEDSGIAPESALNVGDVLPPVDAEQWEVGASYPISPRLTLIAALFDISKPIAALDQAGFYAFVGDVRHSGVEVSLAGMVGNATQIVFGAVALDPVLSGALVEQGVIESTPPGVSSFTATLNFEHQLGNGWALDGQYLYEGPRRISGTSANELPAVGFLTLGGRKSWLLGDSPLALRFQVANVLNEKGYFATPSGALAPVTPATARLIFTYTM